MAPGRTRTATPPADARDRPDVFLSYAREDIDFADRQLTSALVAREKNVWIDVEDIRGGASDWRASVWAGIESATVMVFVLTPDSLTSTVCGEELQHAAELNKRIIPVLRRSVDGLQIPEALERPNWVFARPEDDFETSITSLIDALELDEAWVEQHARLTQRTGEWLRHDRDGSYLLRGSDLRSAESWLDDQEGHREAPTAEQVTYITASRRAAARRQLQFLTGGGLAIVIMAVLAVVAIAQRAAKIDREETARARALAAQSIGALSLEESLREALKAVDLRSREPEAVFALRRAVSLAGWTSILRLPGSRGAPLKDVEFSEDGRRVATAGSDGRVAVWDTRSGRRRVMIVTRGGTVHTVQFSPDGRQLLTASEDGIARTWDSSTGRRLHEFDTTSKDRSELTATWGAGGRRILTAGSNAGEVWDAKSGARLYQLRSRSDDPRTSRMSLDGRRALTAGKGGSALLWNLENGGKPTTLPGKDTDALVYSLLSSNGRRAATFYSSGRFCVWPEGRVTSRLCVPGGKVDLNGDVDLSRNGRRVLRAYASGRIEVWDVRSQHKEPIAVLGNGTAVVSAQFDRSGEYVVAGGDDGVSRVWHVKPKRLVSVLRGHTESVNRARFSPNGSFVATVSDDGSGKLWPVRSRTPADPGWQSAESTTFSPKSRDVLIVRRRRNVWADAVWNGSKIVQLKGGVSPDTPDPATWPCGRAAGCSPWSPNGRFVAGINAARRAVIWDAHTGKARAIKPTEDVTGAAFSEDGRRLVVFSANQPRARIWDVETGKPGLVVPALRATGGLFSAQFVPNSRWVLTVDTSMRAQLSDPATGETVLLSGHVLPVGVAAAKDGRRIAVGTTGGKLLVFSGDGTKQRSAETPSGAVNSIAFDETGTTIVTGGQRGTAVIWDVRTLTPKGLTAPGAEVSGVAFGGSDGNLVLVTAGTKARLWDKTLLRVVAELPRTRDVRVELRPDGRRIVLAGKTRLEILRCWACAPLDDLEQRARSLLRSS